MKRVTILTMVAAVILLITGAAMAGEALQVRAPIIIIGDEAATEENGVISGTGRRDDPFIIAGFKIDASEAHFGIHIERVTKYFRIEKNMIIGARAAAIFLKDLSHVVVADCTIIDSHIGIQLLEVRSITIYSNILKNSSYAAILLIDTSDTLMYRNTITGGHIGIYFVSESSRNRIIANDFIDASPGIVVNRSLGNGGNWFFHNNFIDSIAVDHDFNRWDDGKGRGNFWSRHRGKDANNDGISDRPQRIFGAGWNRDNFPLMEPWKRE
ncbi:right-handed parallel beta-helix repeat-containing protein [Candidatus Acetothermia bacterium]|nr:right-handed parallel beta-helix repeat-containing protein [Candidatus Acetothermia bacterium]